MFTEEAFATWGLSSSERWMFHVESWRDDVSQKVSWVKISKAIISNRKPWFQSHLWSRSMSFPCHAVAIFGPAAGSC